MDATRKYEELLQASPDLTFYDPAAWPLTMYGLLPDYRRMPK